MGMREWLGKGCKGRNQAEWSCCRPGRDAGRGEGWGGAQAPAAGGGLEWGGGGHSARSGTMAVGNEAQHSAHVRTSKWQIPSSLALPQKDYTEDQMK